MSSILTSQGVVLATVMAVSSTVVFLAFSKQKTLPHQVLSENRDSESPTPSQDLRSCLSSEGKRKKKRVQFAENVKNTKGNGDEYRRERQNPWHARREREVSNTRMSRVCRNEIQGNHGMPENRVALYSGILVDRVHKMECSYLFQ
ncbi:hypothetical protein POTOM_005085 [Populus tomentosa]|uniref:Uncharacterized protein n=1 Tax=Populus tomentosa TaxID=118781 RepID=A0A8X8DDW8_POPTO|nr:hypothetical protein POTOM_005085 [Populus tomentosa]